MAYVIVKAQCVEVFSAIKALEPFVDQHQVQDSIPLATIESAIKVILKDSEQSYDEGENFEHLTSYQDNAMAQSNNYMNAMRIPSVASWMSRKSVAIYS